MSQQIFPSNMALIQQKAKLKSANKGKDLLKRKADALKAQFREILKNLTEKKRMLGSSYNDALLYLAKASYSSHGDINRTIEENVKNKSDIKLNLTSKNIAGVVCPQFKIRNLDEERIGSDMDILGITGGGHTLNIAKKQFLEYIQIIVSIATLQTNYKSVDETLKITNRRVNALEYVVVPRIKGVMKYIDTELQERAKEDKFRIKKVLQNKKKHAEKAEKLKNENKDKDAIANDKEEEMDKKFVIEEDSEEEQGEILF